MEDRVCDNELCRKAIGERWHVCDCIAASAAGLMSEKMRGILKRIHSERVESMLHSGDSPIS